MIIIPPRGQAGIAGKAGSKFTGLAFPYLTMQATDGVVINTVSFTPCARTYWHRHEKGQILIVLAGRGRIQAAGEPVRVIRVGDTVWTPAGESHWHGGSSDSFMTHIAISLGTTEWADKVTEDEFNARPSNEEE